MSKLDDGWPKTSKDKIDVDEFVQELRRPLTPLSQEAWDARKPPAPSLLLEADQERPDTLPAKARTVRAKRPNTGKTSDE